MALLFLGIYASIVAYTTLLPFQFTLSRIRAHADWETRPFPWQVSVPLSDLVGNVVLFLPVGVFAIGMQTGRIQHRLLRVGLAGGLGLLFSLGIESIQWFTPTRSPAFSDVVSNTVGALLGAGMAAFLGVPVAKSRWCQRLAAWMRHEPAVIVCGGLLALTSVWALVPFDVSVHPHSLERSLRTRSLFPFWTGFPLVDVSSGFFFALCASMGISVLDERRPPRRFRNAVILLGAIGLWELGLEVLQLAVKSRLTAMLDVGTAIAGGLIGILVAGLIQRTGDREARKSLPILAYVAGLLLLAMRPLGAGFGVEVVQRRLIAFLPGYVPHFDAGLDRVTGFVHGVLLFVPLGYLLRGGPWFLDASRSLLLSPLAPLGCGLVGASMSFVLSMSSDSPLRVDLVAACLGGVLGSGIRSWALQLECARGNPEADDADPHSEMEFQTGTGLARKHADVAVMSRTPSA